MTDKIYGLLGLMRKAGAVVPGMENSEEAIRKGKAKVVILSGDASDRTKNNIRILLENRNAEQITFSESAEELAAPIGIGGCTVLTVTDLGFADALMQALAAEDPVRYGQCAEKVRQRLEKFRRRKSEKPGIGKKESKKGR